MARLNFKGVVDAAVVARRDKVEPCERALCPQHQALAYSGRPGCSQLCTTCSGFSSRQRRINYTIRFNKGFARARWNLKGVVDAVIVVGRNNGPFSRRKMPSTVHAAQRPLFAAEPNEVHHPVHCKLSQGALKFQGCRGRGHGGRGRIRVFEEGRA